MNIATEIFNQCEQKYKEAKRYEGIYCDMLNEIFENETGLVTTMPRIIGINC